MSCLTYSRETWSLNIKQEILLGRTEMGMITCVGLSGSKEKRTRKTDMLGMEQVSLMISWCQVGSHTEHKDHNDRIKHYTTTDAKGIKKMGTPKEDMVV